MQRRQVLLAKIAGQREQVAELATRWQPAFRMANQTMVAVHFLRSNVILLAGLAGLALVRRNGVTMLVQGGWRAWKAWRYLSVLSEKITPRR